MAKRKNSKKSYPAKKKGIGTMTTTTSEPTTPATPQETAADTIGNTRKWARECHGGQKDKANKPYVTHLDGVARNVYRLVGKDIDLIQAAYCHDLIEDTAVTSKLLAENGFSKRTIDAVIAVTKVSGEQNYGYISYIIDSGIDPMIVKLADLYHNTEPARLNGLLEATRERLMKKYYPAIWRLERALIASGLDITPTMTFERALDAAKPKSTYSGPKWRNSTSPITATVNDLMYFGENEPESDDMGLVVKTKVNKDGGYYFTFTNSSNTVFLKSGDKHWIKWGGGSAASKGTSASKTTSTGTTYTYTPEWIKYLGLPKDWKEGDPFPDPLVTYDYTFKSTTQSTTSSYVAGSKTPPPPPAGVTPKNPATAGKELVVVTNDEPKGASVDVMDPKTFEEMLRDIDAGLDGMTD